MSSVERSQKNAIHFGLKPECKYFPLRPLRLRETRLTVKTFDFVLRLCYKDQTYIEHDHIQAKGIPFNSGADPPL
jgi:hypothetical protein